jgi:hypothetical protein
MAQDDTTLAILDDLSKSAFGFRARKYDVWKNMSNEEIDAEFAYYQRESDESEAREARAEELARARLKEHLNDLMSSHGIDRQTAIRWAMQAADCENDFEHFCWTWGFLTKNTDTKETI